MKPLIDINAQEHKRGQEDIMINWCNENNGFLMAILTLTYVVATFVICYFTYKNAKTMEKTNQQTRDIQNQNVKMQLFESRFNLYMMIKKIIKDKYKAISSPVDMLNKIMSNSAYFEDAEINIKRVKFLFSSKCYDQLYSVTNSIKELSNIRYEMKNVLELLETRDPDYYNKTKIFVEKHQSDQLSEEQIIEFTSLSKKHEKELILYPNNLVRYNFSEMFFKSEELEDKYSREKEILFHMFEDELHISGM